MKNRTEVRGGGKKPWRQKGTGRARQGSIRAPQWRGGGVVFGPNTNRNYKLKMNKKVRQLALKSALSQKVIDNEMTVLDNITFDAPKTKAMIKVFSQELNNTDGQKYTFKYDDKQYIYQVFIDRDYEKATETAKDETWKNTFDEANEYYLKEGYTCNGIKKEPSNELTLTSTTGNNTVDYNNWVVTYQKAILSEDKETLSITLEVKNNGTEARTLNGILKLFDKNNQNVRNTKMNQQIAPGETSTIVIDIKSTNENKDPELGNLEIVNFEDISQYLIELYR